MGRALPVIDRPLDNTALDAYMACPYRYYLSMVLHRRRRGRISPALAYGTSWHSGLETWYKGGNYAEVVKAMSDNWSDHGIVGDHRNLGRCVSAFDNFLSEHGDDRKQTLGYPENPVVELSVNVAIAGSPYSYAGKIDRIFVLHDHIFIEDHKTTSQLGPYFFQNFSLSNQMMGYAYLGKQQTGEVISGIRINAYGALKSGDKFARETISYSQERLDEWADNFLIWAERIDSSYRENEWRQNFNACYGGKYGPCPYVNVCSLPKKRHDTVLSEQFTLDKWDPTAINGVEDDYGVAIG